MKRFFSLCFLLLCLPIAQASLFTSTEIKSDEYVLFFPALAYYDNTEDKWIAHIHGWIFEPTLAASIKALTLRWFKNQKNAEQKAFQQLMKQRLQWFFVDNERNKIISIRLNNKTYQLNKSGANGHFYGRVKIDRHEVNNMTLDRFDRITFKAITQNQDKRLFQGKIQFLQHHGISVISDIDDTIKVSQVHNKRKLLENTFSKPFRAIPGMANSYRRWAQSSRVRFHYLTASPWQLYIPLQRFMQQQGFPHGSFHMKYFRFKDRTVLNVFKNSVNYKTTEITKLIKRFPLRQFILIGDSSEHDLEIYTKIAANYPQQIRAIYIHETTATPLRSTQYNAQHIRQLRCPIIVFNTDNKPAKLPFY